MSKKPLGSKIEKLENSIVESTDVTRGFDESLSKVVAAHKQVAEALRPALRFSELASAQVKAHDVHSNALKSLPTIPKISDAGEFARLARAVGNLPSGRDIAQYAGVVSPAARVEPLRDAPEAATSNVISSVQDVGRMVRAYRKGRNVSQQKFADMAGVGRRFISELENGKGTLEFDKVLKVALAAGIDLSAQKR